MGFYRTFGLTLLTIFLSLLLVFFFVPELVEAISITDYSAYNELGYFVSLLIANLNAITDFKVLIIVIITSIIGGSLIKSKNSFVIGLAAFLIMGLILIIVLWRYTLPFPSISIIITDILVIDMIITFIIPTTIIAVISSSIPGAIYYFYLKQKDEKETELTYETTHIICPKCKKEFYSNPLLCVNCGYNFRKIIENNKEN